MNEERKIELHNGEQPRRRIMVSNKCSVLNVPVQGPDGVGLISYVASGLHTDDGVEIWTPQKWKRQ